MPDVAERKVYSIHELTRLIKLTLEQRFGDVWVEGEVSNVRQPASGHMYFTIKDAQAQISAVMFRGSQRGLKFKPADGVLVRAYGEVSVYERSGNYQIIVRTLEESGKGSLQAQFEALKEKLLKEGLFESSRKKALPAMPQHIGVVTSPTGAAIRDILNVVERRFPNLHIIVIPAKVQGVGAAEEIAAGIDLINAVGGVDALIVGRGGGSIEDLWCFNEEVVARAIARSVIPVISAVGHEIDFTISDFVADLRAPTPSAAAELVVGRKDAFEERITASRQRLGQALRERLLMLQGRLGAAAGSYVFREPGNVAMKYRQRVESLDHLLKHSLVSRVREVRQRIDTMHMEMGRDLASDLVSRRHALADTLPRLQHRMDMGLRLGRERLERYRLQLRALNPRGVLGRGYTLTRTPDGEVLMSAGDVEPGATLVTEFGDGQVISTVDAERQDG